MPAVVRRVFHPLGLLVILLFVSTGARAVWLGEPHSLVSDEVFYVNAARHIASLPSGSDDAYGRAPAGVDPNFEHPPLAKFIIAQSLRLFGNHAFAWRIPSVAMGTVAIAALYWLARSAGSTQWEALGAAGLMAADNMTMVYGRFATLDVFVVCFMIVGIGLYLRDRPWAAGAVIGVGACTKLIGLSAILVVVVIEALRGRDMGNPCPSGKDEDARPRRAAAGRLAACTFAAAIVFLVVLAALDHAVTRFPDPVTHTRQMLNYAERTTFQLEAQARGTWTQGQLAPVARPWEWLVNGGTFTLFHKEAAPPGQPGSERRVEVFQARVTPAILWLAVPAWLFAAVQALRRRDPRSILVAAWCSAVFGILVAVVLRGRITYIYYAVILLPGVYIGIARLVAAFRFRRAATAVYIIVVAGFLVTMFPFRTLTRG